MSEYFPKPNFLEANVKVELDLFNYATKADIKSATVYTLEFARKVDLASLKTEVDRLYIDKLEKVTTGLKSLKSKVYN